MPERNRILAVLRFIVSQMGHGRGPDYSYWEPKSDSLLDQLNSHA